MRVLSLKVLGIHTDRFAEMHRLLSDVMGLATVRAGDGFAEFETENGDVVEIFDESGSGHIGPGERTVIGFRVDDMEGAVAALAGAGIELIGATHTGQGGHKWQSFRAPDGGVYELTYTGKE